MKRLRNINLLLMALLILTGCATLGSRESRVVLPSGEQYKFYVQHDGQLEFQLGDMKAKVNNQGRASLIEQVVTAPVAGVAGAANTMMGNSLKEVVVK